jgi:hypothetical protein
MPIWSVVLRAALALAVLAPAGAATSAAPVPDFGGRWKLDNAKSQALAQKNQSFAGAVFGTECVIIQTAEAVTLQIAAGALKVEAIYRIDGKPSENRSPGQAGQPDIRIISNTSWAGDVLHITTRSESELDGALVPVESLRKMWLTADGDLVVFRQGTPARVVSTAWSVYQRAGG